MRLSASLRCLAALLLFLFASISSARAQREDGFVSLFDGKTLNGWKLVGGTGPGYVVKDGILICPTDGGGNLFTEKEYSDFVLRLEFRYEARGNNGIGIRAPLTGTAAYMGMEIQVIDDMDSDPPAIKPGQQCGSIYMVKAARRGALKKAGEWNAMEIAAVGRRIRIRINDKTVVDADLNEVDDPRTLAEHPGILRDRGHVGLLGHGPSVVSFRNIRIKDLARPAEDNRPPDGFSVLFNGRDLSGWKALVADPPTRAKMKPGELAEAQKKADQEMRKHWKVSGGVLEYDGKNNSLCTVKDYGDFEMLVDWKIEQGGDSGIYLRGSPQIQIWDNPLGSGGLYNNQKNPSNPTQKADRAPGEWNRFRILMVGQQVTVFLNDVLVVQNVTMENYWERGKPIYPVGQIELQHHGAKLYFKNIYLREIPGFVPR